jgi:hypothetical protein
LEVATPADESETEPDEGFDDYAKEQVKRVRVAVEMLAGNVPSRYTDFLLLVSQMIIQMILKRSLRVRTRSSSGPK